VTALREKLLALFAVFINSGLNLAAPILIGQAIDKYVITRQFSGVVRYSLVLLVMYLASLVAAYAQTTLMGGVGQRSLFNLRSSLFNKLQALPVAFFNQNKAGDLISRINNDTEKLNVFFSQGLVQFVSSLFMIVGAGIFVVSISPRLGSAALAPAFLLLIFTQSISGWIKKQNALNLKSVGGMSAEIQESLNNFKAIIAFNRRDYFREKFNQVNQDNYRTAVKAGIVNTVFLTPLYGFASNVAQVIVIAYGIYLITIGNFTLGLLISFLSYLVRFYDPLRQIAQLWSSFQVALASWDRISDILSLDSDLQLVQGEKISGAHGLLEFKNVTFGYPDGKEVLHTINFVLEPGKTYALVGPTGGGKTTTASLMARLYDPTQGTVLLGGQDIRSYTDTERVKKIGFILQEPFLFSGTVGENIVYGTQNAEGYSSEKLRTTLTEAGLDHLLARFEQGLDTKVTNNSDSLSLGQRQMVAFIRAVLRKPELLILDEATANIDTVTEQLLEEVLKKLPATTTRVIIAHRLNTIENADEIFFVNGGEVTLAGSLEHAVSMLLQGKRKS
jgi:ATP-binding cassette subfamily B protein